MLSEGSKELSSYFKGINLNKKRGGIKKIMGELFNDMEEASEFIQLTNDNEHSQIINVNHVNDIPKPDNFENTMFLPNTISNEILSKTGYVYCSQYKILGREVRIYFGLENNKDIALIDGYKKRVLMWLYILNLYSSKKCSKYLDIYIYLNHQEKKLPNGEMEVLSPIHVNSAFTSCCSERSEIVIFRKEEWFKVFIHETMHNFGLDFCSIENKKMKTIMKNVFQIRSTMLMYESYCEFWGTIINSMFISYLSKKNITKDDFIKKSIKNIESEVLFSLFQMNKILDHMGLEYEDLYENEENNIIKRNYLYKEDTNVFAYYIIKTILLYQYDDFFKWCGTNNLNLINFKKTNKNIELFCEFIVNNYENKDFMEHYTKLGLVFETLKSKRGNKVLINTTKMSILEMK